MQQLDTGTYADYVTPLVEVLRERLRGQWNPDAAQGILDGMIDDEKLTDGARILIAAAAAEMYLEQKGDT